MEKDACRSQKVSRRIQKVGQFPTEDFWVRTADYKTLEFSRGKTMEQTSGNGDTLEISSA